MENNRNRAMNLHKCVREIMNNSLQLLYYPVQWVNIINKHRNSAIAILIVYTIMGIVFNSHYTFPHFYLFTSLFMAIGAIVSLCLHYFSKQAPKLVNIPTIVQPSVEDSGVSHCARNKM